VLTRASSHQSEGGAKCGTLDKLGCEWLRGGHTAARKTAGAPPNDNAYHPRPSSSIIFLSLPLD
jgi:hypothetical protein